MIRILTEISGILLASAPVKRLCPEQLKNIKDPSEIEIEKCMDIFFNCSGQDFVKGANGIRIVKEFLKKSKAIWFHRSKFFEVSN